MYKNYIKIKQKAFSYTDFRALIWYLLRPGGTLHWRHMAEHLYLNFVPCCCHLRHSPFTCGSLWYFLWPSSFRLLRTSLLEKLFHCRLSMCWMVHNSPMDFWIHMKMRRLLKTVALSKLTKLKLENWVMVKA